MDFFCKNDKYWNKLEDATSKIIPGSKKADHERRGA